jgi:hypothetical protein
MSRKFSIILSACLACVGPCNTSAQFSGKLADGVAVINPPTNVAKKKPKPEDFNAIFNDLLETDLVDVRTGTADPKLTEYFRYETSNGLYRRLKTKEKNYQGTVLISPAVLDDKQIVVIAVRILYKHWPGKSIDSQYLHVVFSTKGQFVEIRKGIATTQDLSP